MDNLRSVLFVLPAHEIGGAETKFFNIIKHLTHVKCLLLTQCSIADFFSVPGITTYTFEEFGCQTPMPFSITSTIKYSKAIADIARRENPDCLVGIMHTGSFYVSAAKDIFRLRIPHIGTIEGNVTAFFKILKRPPTLIEKALLWYILRRPSEFVVPSHGVMDDIRENFHAHERRTSVIYNGIDIDGIRKMASETVNIRKKEGRNIIATACRLSAQKDFVTLIRAFRAVREKADSELIIVGDGELRDEIMEIAKSLDVERDVTITGFKENPFPYIREADVFVLSSFAEGFGNVIIEAMALDVPVVASDCPSGPGEIIQNGINGFLVPVRDHNKMAEAILKLMTDSETRNELISHGNERAESFRIETMAEGFRQLISEVTREGV